MTLEFLLMSSGFHSFLLLRDEQNSKCVCVGGGGCWRSLNAYIYFQHTYISFKI
jgi:hypothetical protein